MKILKEKGYSVYVAHKLRHLVQGNWVQLHDSIIRSCKIFVLINTIDALERPEIIREIKVAFPNGDTSTHSFWIFRDQKFDAPHNSPTFQQGTGIDLSKQSQAPFRNPSELNSTIILKCLDQKQRLKEPLEKEVNPTTLDKTYFSNKIRSALGAHINQALLTQLDDAVDRQDFGTALHFPDLALLEIEQPPVEILYNKAWLLNKLGRNREALDILSALLTQHPDNVEVNYLKAVIKQNQRNYGDAINLYEKVLDLDSSDLRALNSKASALAKIGDKPQSVSILEKITRLDPNFADAWYNLGVEYALKEICLVLCKHMKKQTCWTPGTQKAISTKA
jgi:hypothetical protein